MTSRSFWEILVSSWLPKEMPFIQLTCKIRSFVKEKKTVSRLWGTFVPAADGRCPWGKSRHLSGLRIKSGLMSGCVQTALSPEPTQAEEATCFQHWSATCGFVWRKDSVAKAKFETYTPTDGHSSSVNADTGGSFLGRLGWRPTAFEALAEPIGRAAW